MPPNLLLVLVAVFGFVVHALSTDGGGTVLMYLGAPATWAIPKGLVNPLILLAGLADAIFQGVQHGLSWEDAATQGALASLVALGGAVGAQHTLGRDAEGHSLPVTPPKGLVVLLAAGALVLSVSGCAAFQKALPYLPTPKTLACIADDVEKGVENPITIVSDCPELAVVAAVDVEALITELLMAKRAQRMAAKRAGAAYCADAGADAQ
jgi:hypothetical protein